MKIVFFLFLVVLLNPSFAEIQKKFSVDSLQSNKPKPSPSLIDNWIAQDKGMHLVGSFIVTGVTTLSLKRFGGYSRSKSVNIGVSFSFGLGLVKEIYDGRNDKRRFSYKDLTADIVGSFLGYLVFR